MFTYPWQPPSSPWLTIVINCTIAACQHTEWRVSYVTKAMQLQLNPYFCDRVVANYDAFIGDYVSY